MGFQRENVDKVAPHMFFYASGLSFRTGIKFDSLDAHGLMSGCVLSLSILLQRSGLVKLSAEF